MASEEEEREAAKLLFGATAKTEEEVARGESDDVEIPFVCPFCNETYLVSAELAGKKINCRNCREPCRVEGGKKEVPEDKPRPRQRTFSLGFLLGLVVGIGVALLAVGALKLLRVF
jgi:hypothetical protein